ncbi:hypothetical protein SEA_DENNEBES_76 [Streptomyces phage Dennebes]|jgi:hypothetical protein|nr:hypothetical protein SEA_DENNEBES_76 [Streptomyces phage Dennebes]
MTWQWIVWTLGLGALAFYAQYQRVLAEDLATALLEAHAWVDEIIEALENPDESEANKSLDRLVAQRVNDERSVGDQH